MKLRYGIITKVEPRPYGAQSASGAEAREVEEARHDWEHPKGRVGVGDQMQSLAERERIVDDVVERPVDGPGEEQVPEWKAAKDVFTQLWDRESLCSCTTCARDVSSRCTVGKRQTSLP